MTPAEFIAKWQPVTLRERAGSQEHFLDLCALVGHETPAKLDPVGKDFTFEKGAKKNGNGGDGWADVWKRGYFGWEYKGKKKDLDAAYAQLLKYRESLDSPPLLVVSDMDRIVIRTNFTNTPTQTFEIRTSDLAKPAELERLRAVFHDPEQLRPGATTQAITQEAAQRITDIAQSLRSRGFAPQSVARFLDRIVFSMFAEDVGLLPGGLFSRIVHKSRRDPQRFTHLIRQLFKAMAVGGDFGADTIKYFNGDLFAGVEVLALTASELDAIRDVSGLDWSAIDPSIFGTLFERALDPDKRAQLGAHYTGREDIERIVEPVVMVPLRREWDAVRQETEAVLRRRPLRPADQKKADGHLRRFAERLQQVRVLDPACGSGNFLYVVLHKLKDLEKEVITFAIDHGFSGFLPHVGPWQLHGIETNAYAFELAQMTIWIGWLQWMRANGYGEPSEPILQKLVTFTCRDAILTRDDATGALQEPEWPTVDFTVGNPPFLGGKKLRTELQDGYVDDLFTLWHGRVPPEADLCCYWFEKVRAQIQAGKCRRAGLLATQGIRGGANREVLKRIKQSGDIFFAESDRPWVLAGANVHVSMVGFDGGEETTHTLDGVSVPTINANLTAATDLTQAQRLPSSIGLAFMGDTKGGSFDIQDELACELLQSPNPHGRPNSDVIVPWMNGLDVARRQRRMWAIDFGVGMSQHDAARYQEPFEYVAAHVKPERKHNKRDAYKDHWWLHVEPRPGMRSRLASLQRFLATTRVSKHRLFSWMSAPTLPDCQLIVFASQEDWFFGILQSRVHKGWALKLGSRLETRPRYTPTTSFETFPFPITTDLQKARIAAAARELNTLRERWSNPPEWVHEEVLEFPASVRGPWSALVKNPNSAGIGTARYVRLVPNDDEAERHLQKRTLTHLYNEPPTWLTDAHRALDEAVLEAYGWSTGASDEELLAKLLRLNLDRAGQGVLDFEAAQRAGSVVRTKRPSRGVRHTPIPVIEQSPDLSAVKPRMAKATTRSLRLDRNKRPA
jgi:type II restriction/modification system DNA methylase subunit YeeA